MTLGQFGLEAPERCKTCPKLGDLATKLSVAQGNKDMITLTTDPEVLAASARAQLTQQIREHYPDASDEQVTASAEDSVAKFLGSEKHADFLKYASAHLAQEDTAIAATATAIDELLIVCPPDGCDAK